MSEKLLRRKLEDEIKKYVNRREIIGIRGARQTGKTTLLKMISENIKTDKAFINLDLPEYRRTLEENPIDFVKRYKKGKKLCLFLDEIQRVKDAGEKIKIIYDEFPDVKMFISGSSSLEMKTNILPHLVGRLFLYELYTFDFEEFLSYEDTGLQKIFKEKQKSLKNFLEDNDDIAPPSFTEDYLKKLQDYLIFGGYPEVVKAKEKEEKIDILKNISTLYLEKDISSFFKVEDTPKFENLLKLLSFNTSNILITSSISSDLKLSYRKVEEFLTILQHTYVIHLIKPFYKNITTELKKSPKIYFLDLGLRNAVINNFSSFNDRVDKGQLVENFVFRELLTNFKDWKLNYWRTTGKAEVDFVLRKQDKIVPIEVKLSGENLGKSFYSFLYAYKPEKAIVVSLDKFKKEKVNKTIVYWVPLFYF